MKKKILFRIENMEMGETSIRLWHLIHILSQRGNKVILLVDMRQGELLESLPKEVKIVSLGQGKEYLSEYAFLRYVELIDRAFILMMYRLFPILLFQKIGVVPDIEISMQSSLLRRLLRSPFTTSKKIHWFDVDSLLYKKRGREKLLSRLHQCDITVFPSDGMKNSFERAVRIEVYNSTCINPILNLEAIKKKSLEAVDFEDEKLWFDPTFLSIGELAPYRGYDLLLETHGELIKEGVNHRILILGDGPQYDSLQRRIKELQVENTFLLLGIKTNPYAYMAKCTYYIEPWMTYFSIHSLEAMYLGKVVMSPAYFEGEDRDFYTKSDLLSGFSKRGFKKGIKKFLYDSDFVSSIALTQKGNNFHRDNQRIVEQMEELLH
ncbi:glycosyltransferase [Chryseobacterium potabilaquae]|uniref:N-acetylgalactosamine-N, N'-diacetylbacillosaminyl-diphospho-undecaprenol 4-alpha-N-acetylgalactosaminyltransferase n=1 Tax=Chryseobacterium potabilaquae TaxID=2675057 RepID=A0A6N4XDJ9_9FLAO|nr:glycosyltransferase [Chryseobacterium potabilaquae]CAA7196669.1 N-acetylgalactosamine-N, N'-diacetylbacillosaminyl-diphospho-undecaprenol 4-alpha-N-acetylgalactosaminyltransferase [Chryseobacterium potabilaquae]